MIKKRGIIWNRSPPETNSWGCCPSPDLALNFSKTVRRTFDSLLFALLLYILATGRLQWSLQQRINYLGASVLAILARSFIGFPSNSSDCVGMCLREKKNKGHQTYKKKVLGISRHNKFEISFTNFVTLR